MPDRIGDPVEVSGRVTVGSGLLRSDLNEVYIQDGTAGVRLRLPADGPRS